MTIDPTFFPDLLYISLQCHAERWAKDFKQINRIYLHQCEDPLYFKTKYVRYVVVFEHNLAESDSEFKDLCSNFYSIDRLTHDGFFDERFIDVYHNVPGWFFRDEWDFVLRGINEDISGIMNERFFWQLLPAESLDESSDAVLANAESEPVNSERVDGFVEGLRVFAKSDVEIGIKEHGKAEVIFDRSLMKLQSHEKGVWKLLQKVLQSRDHVYDIKEIRPNKSKEANRKMLTNQINRGLVTVFQRLFLSKGIPEGYKFYKLKKEEGKGCYEFKFKITRDTGEIGNSKYRRYGKTGLLNKIKKLSKDYESSMDEYKKKLIFNEIADAVIEAERKAYITVNEVKKYLPKDFYGSETFNVDTSKITPHNLLYSEHDQE